MTRVEPTFTLKASDPCAPFALLAYASMARNMGYPASAVQEIKTLADDMYEWQDRHAAAPALTQEKHDE